MECSHLESPSGKEKDLLQQALDLSAIGEDECMGAQEDQAESNIQFESGGNVGKRVPDWTNSTDLLPPQNVSQIGMSEKFDKKDVRVEDPARTSDQSEASSYADGKNAKAESGVETKEKKVSLVIPKIPSVVVRNENNDIIEQMNEPDSLSKRGSSSASVKQTLKSKIMEKSKSLDMGDTVEQKNTLIHSQDTVNVVSDERKGLSNSAPGLTHNPSNDINRSENSESYSGNERKNEKIDLSKVSVNMPSIATAPQPGPANYGVGGPVVSTLQHNVAPIQGGQFNAPHLQPGMVPMHQRGTIFSPRMVPYAQPMMMTQQMTLINRQPQQVQQLRNTNQPPAGMPRIPLPALPTGKHGIQGNAVQGKFGPGQFQGGPLMQQVSGFIPMQFPSYPQHVMQQQGGRGPLIQTRPVIQQSTNPVISVDQNIVSPLNQDGQRDTVKIPNKAIESEKVKFTEVETGTNSSVEGIISAKSTAPSERTVTTESSISTTMTVSSKSTVSTQSTLSTAITVSAQNTKTTANTLSTESDVSSVSAVSGIAFSTKNTAANKNSVSTPSTISTTSVVSAQSTASTLSVDSTQSIVPTQSTVSAQGNIATQSSLPDNPEVSIQSTDSTQTSSAASSSGSGYSSKEPPESEFTKPFELAGYKSKKKGDSSKNQPSSNEKHDDPVNQFSFYKCDKCNYRTKYRSNFRNHYSHHLSYKPYSCEYCKFQTYANNSISHHMKTHSDQDPSGFYYFPDSAIEKSIEFHCDDCKEVKWVNDQELVELKKEILSSTRHRERIKKTKRKDDQPKEKESESKHSNLKRKADVLDKTETTEVKVKKKPGRKPKAYKTAVEIVLPNVKDNKEEKATKKDLGTGKATEEDMVTEDATKEDSGTEDDEETSSKKIPNYEIVDATNILETPKRKRKFKTLFDPSPELYQQKKFAHLAVSDDLEKFTPPMKRSSKLKCPYCPYKSNSPIGIRRHAFWRHKSCTYCCDNCPFKAKSAAEVLAHYEEEHPKMNPIVKKIFDREFDQDGNTAGEDNVNQSKEEGTEEEKDQGKVGGMGEENKEKECKGEEKSDDKVEEEMKMDDNKTEIRPLRKGKVESLQNKSLYQCTQCPYKSNALGVQSHMLRKHNICQYFCGVCAFESDNESIVKEHFKKEHPTDDLAISRGFVKLNSSESKTDMAKKKPKKICAIRTLKRSKDTVRFKPTRGQGPDRDSPAECPICGFKSRYTGVQRHISMIHGLLKWQCGKCGIQLFSKGETFEHSLTVHDTHAPCVIRSFFEVEKIKELKDSNSLIIEKNGKVKIGAPGEGMVVTSTSKQAPVEPTSAAKTKKEEFVKDTQCPECSFSSNVKGVQRHLMLIHKICRWQCKICGFGSLDEHVTLEHSVDMHEGMEPKIVRAFVDIDRYNAEKRLNASDEQELQNQSASKQTYLFDFDETSSNENYDEDALEKSLDLPFDEKLETKTLSSQTSVKSKEDKTSEPYIKKLTKSLSSPAGALADAPVFSPAEVAKKRTKTPSPRALSLDIPLSSATGDSEIEIPTKKKRGRPKGSGTTVKGMAAISKKDCSSTFVLKPKELNLLQQGFSCVYCVYAAPLRHQVRLHCYDKHTNHPACLMEFKVDTQCFRSDGVIDMEGDSTDTYERSKGQGKTENVQEEFQDDGNVQAKMGKSCDHTETIDVDPPAVKKSKLTTDIQQNENSVEKDFQIKNLNEDATVTKDKNESVENGFNCRKERSEGKSDSFDTASTHSGTDVDVDELHISEIFDNGKRFKSSRKQRKKFDNPLKTLVNKLRTGRINLEDPFHGTLDEVDSILFQFGVRTLNMDMLTQQQFSNFISKFGADLQPA